MSGGLLALDLGTTTGWAVRTDMGNIVSGTHGFKPGRFEGGGMRFLRFLRWLDEVTATTGTPAAIYFEEVRRHAGVDAAHVYGGLLATLTAWCEGRRVPYQGVPVATIKKHAAGKGNADKAAVISAMRALGFAPSDDNEADALAILCWAQAQGHEWGDSAGNTVVISEQHEARSVESSRAVGMLARVVPFDTFAQRNAGYEWSTLGFQSAGDCYDATIQALKEEASDPSPTCLTGVKRGVRPVAMPGRGKL